MVIKLQCLQTKKERLLLSEKYELYKPHSRIYLRRMKGVFSVKKYVAPKTEMLFININDEYCSLSGEIGADIGDDWGYDD